MKLSRRGVRNVGIMYGVCLIGIGIGYLMKTNPDIWVPVFAGLGIIFITVCSYGYGKAIEDIESCNKAKGHRSIKD